MKIVYKKGADKMNGCWQEGGAVSRKVQVDLSEKSVLNGKFPTSAQRAGVREEWTGMSSVQRAHARRAAGMPDRLESSEEEEE